MGQAVTWTPSQRGVVDGDLWWIDVDRGRAVNLTRLMDRMEWLVTEHDPGDMPPSALAELERGMRILHEHSLSRGYL